METLAKSNDPKVKFFYTDQDPEIGERYLKYIDQSAVVEIPCYYPTIHASVLRVKTGVKPMRRDVSDQIIKKLTLAPYAGMARIMSGKSRGSSWR